jgi:hypothetical protein
MFEPSLAANHNALNFGSALVDLAWVVLAITATSTAVWGVAQAARQIDRRLLMLLVVIPEGLTVQALLRRYCYPNTTFADMFRTASVSSWDQLPAPLMRKVYVALLSGVTAGIAVLLAYVILSRTWQAAIAAPPKTSLLYDVLHPWSVVPLHQGQPAQNPANAAPPSPVPWWIWPGIGVLGFPLVTLAWCGTLERNARLARAREGGAAVIAEPDLSWARVGAVVAVLLFWLPVIGLLIAVPAYWLNRRSSGWTSWGSKVALVATVLVNVVLVVMLVVGR